MLHQFTGGIFPQPFGPIGSIRLTYFFGDPAIKHVGSIRSVGGPWIPINLYGFLWFPKGISVTKKKKPPGKIQMPWSSDERRSDSWAPSWTTPTFGGEALDLDPPQGQTTTPPPFLGCKNLGFFFMRESVPKSRRIWKKKHQHQCDHVTMAWDLTPRTMNSMGHFLQAKVVLKKPAGLWEIKQKTRWKNPWEKRHKKKAFGNLTHSGQLT